MINISMADIFHFLHQKFEINFDLNWELKRFGMAKAYFNILYRIEKSKLTSRFMFVFDTFWGYLFLMPFTLKPIWFDFFFCLRFPGYTIHRLYRGHSFEFILSFGRMKLSNWRTEAKKDFWMQNMFTFHYRIHHFYTEFLEKLKRIEYELYIWGNGSWLWLQNNIKQHQPNNV